jgi:6-pyruvoyltetrahydropterin/6-carboxytetrahydropterin synthase
MVIVHRKEHFNAAHKLYNPDWSREKNEEVFGPCANENWHGHNFELTVSVIGEPNPETGFVMDLKKLSSIIKTKVIDKLDHKNLNLDVDFMQGKLTSCENLITEIWNILEPEINKEQYATLYRILLYETVNNFVEYYGPEFSNKPLLRS